MIPAKTWMEPLPLPRAMRMNSCSTEPEKDRRNSADQQRSMTAYTQTRQLHTCATCQHHAERMRCMSLAGRSQPWPSMCSKHKDGHCDRRPDSKRGACVWLCQAQRSPHTYNCINLWNSWATRQATAYKCRVEANALHCV